MVRSQAIRIALASVLFSACALATPAPQTQSHVGSAPLFTGNLLSNPGFEVQGGSVNNGAACPAILGLLPADWSDNSCWG